MRTITEDEWIEQYKPILNHFKNDENESWNGTMYETYGEEDQYIREKAEIAEAFVWTLLEADGVMSIVSGWHYVNRFGYFLTELPADEDFIDVVIEDLTEEE